MDNDTLNSNELAVCKTLGIEPQAFLRTRHENADGKSSVVAASAASGLSSEQLAICASLAVDPAAYSKTLQAA